MTFSNRTIVRVVVLSVIALLALGFFRSIIHPLTLIAISIFLALALNPAVSWIATHLKVKSRARATAVAYVTVLLFLVAFFLLIIPPLVQQSRDFVRDVPRLVSDFQRQDSSPARFAQRLKINEQMQSVADDFSSKFSEVDGPVLSTGKRIGVAIISVITVVVMTFMMLVEGPSWIQRFWAITPPEKRKHRQYLAGRMYRMVTGFVNGQLLLSIIAGTFAFVALLTASTLLNVSINAVALAGIVAVFGIIPMLGNPIAATIVILVCLFSSVNLALIMLIYFIVYFQIENVTLQPYIQSRKNELSPLTVFVAAILGIGFAGFIGALVAIPAAGCIKILIEDYYSTKLDKKTKPDKAAA